MSGNHEEAIRSFERGIRLSPLDPGRHNNLAGIGVALIELGRFEEAVTISKQSLRQNSSDGVAPRGLAAALAHLRRDAEAAKAAARVLEVIPPLQYLGGSLGVDNQTRIC